MPQPIVTGVSPKEGPPGTKVIIRGENLGKDQRDLIGLLIDEVECVLSAEWKSSNKIIAFTSSGKGTGEIIVTTKSGGTGTCTVKYRGIYNQIIGPLDISAVWVDETQTVLNKLGRSGNTNPLAVNVYNDPLGIDSVGTVKSQPVENMAELFPGCSGNLSQENFSPAWYLLENHYGASFEGLKAGLNNMKLSSGTRAEGPIAFVKTNIGAILDCLESLDTMYARFTEDDLQRDTMNSFAVTLMQAKSCADGLFDSVLGRKDEADATRNTLTVLQKFNSMFILPLNIERNIQKGNYDLVVADYVKAKSLFANTEVKIFKKVYAEIEEKIGAFRDMLKAKLLKVPNALEDQKEYIKYLALLEGQGDPAWECIQNQNQWVMTLLIECKTHHINEKDDVNLAKSDPDTSWKVRTPHKVLFLEELSDMMMKKFHEFWKLGQAYVSGYFTVSEEETTVRPDPTKCNLFKEMIASIIKYFSNIVRAAFLPKTLGNVSSETLQKYGVWPDSKDNISGSWLPHCVRYVRSCGHFLCGLELPDECQELLRKLAFDMRTNYMFIRFNQAISDVKNFHSKETWVLKLDDEFGGRTQLPALFESIVNETIQELHYVVVRNKPGELEIFSDAYVQKKATTLCVELLTTFATSMELLAISKPDSETATSSEIAKQVSELHGVIGQHIHQEAVLSKEKKLLIMLSNCHYTRTNMIPRLVENLDKHGYAETNMVLQLSSNTYKKLDKKLFEAYIEEKSSPIVGAMEPNMYRGQFDWKYCRFPTDVRNYLKEVIMGMIEVQAEVFSISPAFITRVMIKVVDGVVEEFSRLIQCVPEFGTNGILQARLEILCLQHTVELYKTDNTVAVFQEALDHLPDIGQEENRKVEDLINKFKSRMNFQLMCFME